MKRSPEGGKRDEGAKSVGDLEGRIALLVDRVRELTEVVDALEEKVDSPETLMGRVNAVEAVVKGFKQRIETLISGLVLFFGKEIAPLILKGRGLSAIPFVPNDSSDVPEGVPDDEELTDKPEVIADSSLTMQKIVKLNFRKFGSMRSRTYRIATHLAQSEDHILRRFALAMRILGTSETYKCEKNQRSLETISDEEIRGCNSVLCTMGLCIEECGDNKDSLKIVRIGSPEPTKEIVTKGGEIKEGENPVMPKDDEGEDAPVERKISPSALASLNYRCPNIFRQNNPRSSLLLALAEKYDEGVKAGILLSELVSPGATILVDDINDQIKVSGYCIVQGGEGKRSTVHLAKVSPLKKRRDGV